jgi:hypothetical protein
MHSQKSTTKKSLSFLISLLLLIVPSVVNAPSAAAASGTPTDDVVLSLTTPAADANNTITGGGAVKTVAVAVANTTASVAITGTKLAGQDVSFGGTNANKLAFGGTATAPIYYVDTVLIKTTGGSYEFILIVSETGKDNIVYTVTVTVAPDTTAPVLSAASTSSTTSVGTNLGFSFTGDAVADYYYLVQTVATADPANPAALYSHPTNSGAGVAAGNSVTISGLTSATDYEIFLIVQDAATNRSIMESTVFTTLADTTAPDLSAASTSGTTATGTTLGFTFGNDLVATYFYIVQTVATADPADAAAVESGKTATSSAVAAGNSIIISGLTSATDYEIFLIVKDAAGNISNVQSTIFTTSAVPAPSAVSGGTPVYYQETLVVISSMATVQLTKTATLSTTGGSGYGAVSYATSTPLICTVSSTGLLTALFTGDCLVTATKAAANGYVEKSSSSLTVKISDTDKKAADAKALEDAKALADKTAADAKALADKAAADAKALADKAAADAKALADKAAADAKALADKAAADAKALADKAAADAKELADAVEAARLAAIEKARTANTLTYSVATRTKVIKANLSVEYANAKAVLQLGMVVKGKISYKNLVTITLNGNGDGVFKTTSTVKNGNSLRVLVGQIAVKTVKVS